ncbi:MAG: HAD family hydrolase [Bacteroidota bacterium]
MSPKFSAVLFDLDGTLLDTLDDLAASMNAVLAGRGLPGHPVEAYRHFVGDGMETLVRRALPAGSDEAAIAASLAAMRAEYGRRWADQTRPYPGVPDMLDALAARGLPMAILSNKPDDFSRLTVERLLPRWRFRAVVGMRPGVPRKPDPAAALQIASELKIPPNQFIYLGDTGTDMCTARGAGMYAVGALWGFRTAEELRENGAARLIAAPGELLALLTP